MSLSNGRKYLEINSVLVTLNIMLTGTHERYSNASSSRGSERHDQEVPWDSGSCELHSPVCGS